jgi:hypothetical protein
MLHQELYHYSLSPMAPWLHSDQPDYKQFVTEDAEQIYRFALFTPEFCRLLIAEVEHCGQWVTEADTFTSVNILGIPETDDPETTIHLHRLPGLEEVFYEMMERHIRPLAERLWTTFTMQKKDRPYILRYEPTVINKMGLHFDNETVSLVITLSPPEDYEGGGTYFPRWQYSTGKPHAGEAILYPGGVSHEHMGLEITAGKRYLCLCAFY